MILMAVDKNNNEVTNIRIPKELVDDLRFKYQIPKYVTNIDFMTSYLIHKLDLTKAKHHNYVQKFKADEDLIRQMKLIDDREQDVSIEDDIVDIKNELVKISNHSKHMREILALDQESTLLMRIMFLLSFNGKVDTEGIKNELNGKRFQVLTTTMRDILKGQKK